MNKKRNKQIKRKKNLLNQIIKEILKLIYKETVFSHHQSKLNLNLTVVKNKPNPIKVYKNLYPLQLFSKCLIYKTAL